MVNRRFWDAQIEAAQQRSRLIWLWGARRSGKTCLAQAFRAAEYLDCELPEVRRSLEDPEGALARLRGKWVVLDDVHRLHEPSRVLDAAVRSSKAQVVAISPVRLGAGASVWLGTATQIWLTPMVQADLVDFGNTDLAHRFLHGGLPEHFQAPVPPRKEFQDWMDAYWAKDTQELFRLERRGPFQRFVELIMERSGEMFEATQFTGPCGVSRGTIMKYLAVLEATGVALVVRPFSSRRGHEIIAAPKVYGFDTGFVCVHRGWTQLRTADLGRLWEQHVLNEIAARTQGVPVRYWRDKQGHGVSFVCVPGAEIVRSPATSIGPAPQNVGLPAMANGKGQMADLNPAPQGFPEGKLLALECAWTISDFDPAGLLAFARNYPEARLLVATTDAELSFKRTYNGVAVEFVGPGEAVAQAVEALG